MRQLLAMELLNATNTETYGHPVPTGVKLGTKAGKAILVLGHDLQESWKYIKTIRGQGDLCIKAWGDAIDSWLPQLEETSSFLRPLLDRLAKPAQGICRVSMRNRDDDKLHTGTFLDSYKEKYLTAGPVAWPGVKHFTDGDSGPAIERAFELPGFKANTEGGSVMVGLRAKHHNERSR